jgi:hypothetical protein
MSWAGNRPVERMPATTPAPARVALERTTALAFVAGASVSGAASWALALALGWVC